MKLSNLIDCTQGNMSEVVVGEHPQYGRVVLKRITNRLAGLERFAQRWDQEVSICKLLSFKTQVPKVYESGDLPKKWALYEYVGSRTLQDWIDAHSYPLKREQIKEACSIIRKVLDIIVISFKNGIVHRDITPSNVVLNDEGQPFLIDWGLAAFVNSKSNLHIPDIESSLVRFPLKNVRLTEVYRRHGRPGYAAPEQAEAFYDTPGLKNDMYSLSVLAIHLISGRWPFGELTDSSSILINRQRNVKNQKSIDSWIIDLFSNRIVDFLLADAKRRSIDTNKFVEMLEDINL
ncbi:putative serine/threonine protein kinase [Paenibacillus sp. 598K]|uniref:protein kinase domain-containing protein n=1 Tax=Paenibacillus sp. 598K TaxID=1117987 RepID=UPI000FF987D9|nr:phosphotransferase [Paenibacillus sp. 598K]GBF75590.1 putative serine/threonine protein kinase [Paenibacillus sp. 598K]